MIMKKISLILVFFTLICSLLALSGCHCEPASVEWRLQSYILDYEFVGGVHRKIGFSTASVPFPFVSADFENTYIRFDDDGKIEFSTYEGERLFGTYTWENVGNYTTFHAVFTNGEKMDGDTMSTLDGNKLACTFRGVSYSFGVEELTQTSTEEIFSIVRDGSATGLYEVSIIKTEESYDIIYSDSYTYTVNEETAIYAVRLNSDGSHEELRELIEGTAFSTYNETANYVVIYYVEGDAE